MPLLKDPSAPWRECIRAQVDWGAIKGRSVRSRDFRYVEWQGVDFEDLRELYDLKRDPGENINLLTGSAGHPEAVRLSGLLETRCR